MRGRFQLEETQPEQLLPPGEREFSKEAPPVVDRIREQLEFIIIELKLLTPPPSRMWAWILNFNDICHAYFMVYQKGEFEPQRVKWEEMIIWFQTTLCCFGLCFGKTTVQINVKALGVLNVVDECEMKFFKMDTS